MTAPERDVPAMPPEAGPSPLADPASPIPLTGERTAPGIPEENYWFQRHVVAYRLAADLTRGLAVLDAGCGEGYGTAMLARTARAATGLDLETSVVERAARRYQGPTFMAGDLMSMQIEAGTFEAVVSLQVVEHLPDASAFIDSCARALPPGGLLVLSTPNRLTFSPDGVRNPFHTFEFAPSDLRSLLDGSFSSVRLLGTFHGPRLRALDALLGKPVPERLIEQPAASWPRWLHEVVARVRPGDFAIRDTRLDRALDLIAIARR